MIGAHWQQVRFECAVERVWKVATFEQAPTTSPALSCATMAVARTTGHTPHGLSDTRRGNEYTIPRSGQHELHTIQPAATQGGLLRHLHFESLSDLVRPARPTTNKWVLRSSNNREKRGSVGPCIARASIVWATSVRAYCVWMESGNFGTCMYPVQV